MMLLHQSRSLISPLVVLVWMCVCSVAWSPRPNKQRATLPSRTALFALQAKAPPPPPKTFEEEATAKTTASQPTTTITLEKEESPPKRRPNLPLPRRGLVVSSAIDLPFPAEIAYDAFADLPRQPEWSPWLHSVEYTSLANINNNNNNNNSGRPTSKWTLKVLGVSYSWISVATRQDKPTVIEWESVSGLQNFGRVEFQPHNHQNQDNYNINSMGCRMTMTMTFVPPRLVAAVFRNTKGLERFMEQKMVGWSLQSFSDIIVNETLNGGPNCDAKNVNRTIFFPI